MSAIFSENLKELRKLNNYSQRQIADLINIKRCTYASYEEMRSEPPFEILISICKCYRITDLYGLLTKKLSDLEFITPIEVNKAIIAVNKIKKIIQTV